VIHAGLYFINAYGLAFVPRTIMPLFWTANLLVGMTLVAVAQRRGMVACVVLAALQVLLSIRAACMVVFTVADPIAALPFLLIDTPGTLSLLLLGGAMIRRRQNRKLLRTELRTS